MKSTLLALFALTTLSAPLAACDGEYGEYGESADFRAVTIDDRWAIYTPTSFPEVNTCVDYWNDRCAELSASQCTVAKNRYRCTEDGKSVEIRDTFAHTPSSVSWTAYSLGDKTSSVIEDPKSACKSEKGVDHQACIAMAVLTSAVAKELPEIMESYPGGGAGTIVIQDDLMRIDPKPPEGEDLMWGAADALDWTVPMIEHTFSSKTFYVVEDEIMLKYVVEDEIMLKALGYVIEDDLLIMASFMVSPNGSLSISNPGAVLMQTTDDAELDELEMVDKELVSVEELPQG